MLRWYVLFASRLVSSLKVYREWKLVKVHKPHAISAIYLTYSQPPLSDLIFADKQIWFWIYLFIFFERTCIPLMKCIVFCVSLFSELTKWKCWKCNMSDEIAAMEKKKWSQNDRWVGIWMRVFTKIHFSFDEICIGDDTFDDVSQSFNLCKIAKSYFRCFFANSKPT